MRIRADTDDDVKMALQLSFVEISPACIAGVLTSFPPNFNPRCGRMKLYQHLTRSML